MPESKHRWYQFGMRTMFVVVTVFAVAAWIFKGPAVKVVGQLPSADIRRVCAAVEADNRFQGKRINRIEVLSPTRVTIKVEGESESSGSCVDANKFDSAWVLDHYAGFWSEIKLKVRHE
jgi:hypothetical protein